MVQGSGVGPGGTEKFIDRTGVIAEAEDAAVVPHKYRPKPRMMAGGAGAYYTALGLKKPKSVYR
jgi:hypothetical protein